MRVRNTLFLFIERCSYEKNCLQLQMLCDKSHTFRVFFNSFKGFASIIYCIYVRLEGTFSERRVRSDYVLY
uniref:Uncharacterized protein n=1 Tax=Trichogramma kaykai TaxID=54128 RepID=A0ABD2XBN7_9HYME